MQREKGRRKEEEEGKRKKKGIEGRKEEKKFMPREDFALTSFFFSLIFLQPEEDSVQLPHLRLKFSTVFSFSHFLSLVTGKEHEFVMCLLIHVHLLLQGFNRTEQNRTTQDDFMTFPKKIRVMNVSITVYPCLSSLQ